jgi:hypothetical protein
MNITHLIKNCATICFCGIIFFGCKLPDPPKAIVTVTDEDGVALRDAIVVLDCTPNMDYANTQVCVEGLKQEDNTNKNGQVEFDTKLPAVLKASATYTIGNSTDTLKGDAFVEFKEGEVTEQTIIVYP